MRRFELTLLLLVVLVLVVGCSSGGASASGGGSSIADKVIDKVMPKVGEQMTPTAAQADAESGTFMFDRFMAITDGDSAMAVSDSGNTPGVDWYAFSDGSKITFSSELRDGAQYLKFYEVTR